MRRLTIRERLFLKQYLNDFDATRAAMASYNCKNKNSAAVIGSHILKKPRIQVELNKLLEKTGLTEEHLANKLKNIIDG
jgi:phage terminase small subunit